MPKRDPIPILSHAMDFAQIVESKAPSIGDPMIIPMLRNQTTVSSLLPQSGSDSHNHLLSWSVSVLQLNLPKLRSTHRQKKGELLVCVGGASDWFEPGSLPHHFRPGQLALASMACNWPRFKNRLWLNKPVAQNGLPW